jgi:SAM-dependent methyltransferase
MKTWDVAEAFSRIDESDDEHFYARDRFVSHLDKRALATVERIIGTLIVEPRPVILDLMAGWDSHIPERITPRRSVGLGLNVNELERNQRLTDYVLHDVNKDPRLPFNDSTFDVVLCTVSIDYLIRPLEVIAEVKRVLKPAGLFLVIFSNRFFRPKAIKLWIESSEAERQMYVEELLTSVPGFGPPRSFVSRGKPRPKSDKYSGVGLPSDPVYAAYVEKDGAPIDRPKRPRIDPEPDPCPPPDLVERRTKKIHETLECPYCEERLTEWEVPQSPFTEWPNEYMYICFNNDCPYLISGWDVMSEQGSPGFSYRLMYNPDQDRCMPVPIPSPRAVKEYSITPRG